jgi:hypothetical protein
MLRKILIVTVAICAAKLFMYLDPIPKLPVCSSMSLIHFDQDRITAQTQHQPFALGLQMHDHTLSVLQP